MESLDIYVLQDIVPYLNNDDKLVITRVNKKIRNIIGDILWYRYEEYESIEPNSYKLLCESLCYNNYSIRLFNHLNPKLYMDVFKLSCEYGNTEMVRKIIPFIKYKINKYSINYCLTIASRNYHVDVTNLLLTTFDYEPKKYYMQDVI